MPTVQNVARVNKELQRLGFGTLKDPNLFEQMACVIRDHKHFRSLLMAVDPEQRHIAYEALANKLRFKALPLEEYVIQSQTLAEQKQLPGYNFETLEVTEFKVPEIKTSVLTEAAEKSIARDLREAGATQQLTLVCRKCTFEQSWRVKRRSSAYKLARQEGWYIEPKGVTALCKACKPQAAIN